MKPWMNARPQERRMSLWTAARKRGIIKYTNFKLFELGNFPKVQSINVTSNKARRDYWGFRDRNFSG